MISENENTIHTLIIKKHENEIKRCKSVKFLCHFFFNNVSLLNVNEMTFELIDNVKYFLKGDFYIVGDNSTTEGNGISSQTYEGEITIQRFVNGKPVLEIGQFAFAECQKITKVFIYANIRNINKRAFVWCIKLEYINIPQTVTFIGYAAFCLNNGDGKVPELPMTFEFISGRTNGLYIGRYGIEYRKTFYIIYPSDIIPTYDPLYAFNGATTVYICAPSVFDFYTKQTTTDQSKCPSPLFKAESTFITYKSMKISINILLTSIIILLSFK